MERAASILRCHRACSVVSSAHELGTDRLWKDGERTFEWRGGLAGS